MLSLGAVERNIEETLKRGITPCAILGYGALDCRAISSKRDLTFNLRYTETRCASTVDSEIPRPAAMS